MAWNQPGGNGDNNDPWSNDNRGGGKRGGDQGPPDLDEALRKLQDKMNSIFGGGGGGSQSSGPGRGGSIGVGFIVLVAAILIAGWVAMGFYTVNEQERVVVLRLGKFHDTVQPGLRWNPLLIDRRYSVNVTRVESKDHRALMLTEDENIVDVALKVQYRISDPKSYILRVRDPETSLAHATESALRHVVGTSEMHFILTEGRALMADQVQARLQQYMDDYGTGLQISKVNIESTSAPSQVQAAFDDVIKAREDEQRVKNEAESYANGIVPEARGQAQRLLEEANAYKEQVLPGRRVKLTVSYSCCLSIARRQRLPESVCIWMQLNRLCPAPPKC
jgi:membrane protease subunit HflK